MSAPGIFTYGSNNSGVWVAAEPPTTLRKSLDLHDYHAEVPQVDTREVQSTDPMTVAADLLAFYLGESKH